jgi:DNA repair protein RAD50
VQEFEATVKRLGTLTYLITDYAKSGKAQEELTLHKTLSGVSKNIQLAKERLVQTQPLLDQCRTLVNDQERKKLQLQYNIQILEEKGKLNQLKEQIRNQKAAIEAIEHSDTAGSVRRDLLDRKTMLLEKKNRYEGRYSEIVGRIQSVHNKLKLPEYRDVDKKHRKAKVEYETTHMAADDLKKYQNALDNALLQFHAKKLTEINKIVRELWLMTYKGEDITNIEIQSGQEPGARAQKSYNYRVVMSKGVTELDMRGRCSAGQRVLAVSKPHDDGALFR